MQQAVLAGAEVVGLVARADQLVNVSAGAEAFLFDDPRLVSRQEEGPFDVSCTSTPAVFPHTGRFSSIGLGAPPRWVGR